MVCPYDSLKATKLVHVFDRDSLEESFATECACCARNVTDGVCKLMPLYGELSEESVDGDWVWALHCPRCQTCVALWVLNAWWPWQQLLRTQDSNRVGVKDVSYVGDRLVLFILSQISCPLDASVSDQDESLLTFLCPSSTERGKILWYNGQAVGFYTFKPKGTADYDDFYALPVVDVVYIMAGFRRRGFAMVLVEDIMEKYPAEDVGFSTPLSPGMLAVLSKYLWQHSESRDHLWEVTGCGTEGMRINIWLKLKRESKKRKQTEQNAALPATCTKT